MVPLQPTGTATPPVLLVAVAAILVASVRLHGLEEPLNLAYRGPNRLPVDRRYDRGEQMGYFEHGSTIIVISDKSYDFCDDIVTGRLIRMGQALLRRV